MSYYDAATGLYSSPLPPLTSIPSDLSIYEFFLESDKAKSANEDPTWLIDSQTGASLTRSQAKVRALDIARALSTSHGLDDNSTMVIFSPNAVDYATVMWGAFRLGAICSNANPSYQANELAYQIKLVREHHPVKVVLTHPGSIRSTIEAAKLSNTPETHIVLMCPPDKDASKEDRLLAAKFKTLDQLIDASKGAKLPALAKLRKDEARTKLAFLSFSSGTTGLPKAVSIPHYAVIANILQAAAHWDATAPFQPYDAKTKTGDVIMGCLPMYHIFGLILVLHLSVYQNTPVVVVPKFTLPIFLETIQTYKITTLYVVPPMVIMMAKDDITDKYDLSSLRIGMSGAAPLSEEITRALNKKFPKLLMGQGYGMTETCTLVTHFDPSAADIPGASAGRLVPSVDAKVVSPDGKLLPPGQVGELLTRSPSNALGYLGNEKATKETFDSDNFVHTGDEVYICENGWLYVVDRIKELIKVSGNQVAPAELEGHLLDHEDVQDCCVIGIPDDRAGEKPKAYIVLSPAARSRAAKGQAELDEIVKDLKDFVLKHKIHYKALKEVEFLEAIPKTASGKLLRKDRKSLFLRVLHAQKQKAAAAKL